MHTFPSHSLKVLVLCAISPPTLTLISLKKCFLIDLYSFGNETVPQNPLTPIRLMHQPRLPKSTLKAKNVQKPSTVLKVESFRHSRQGRKKKKPMKPLLSKSSEKNILRTAMNPLIQMNTTASSAKNIRDIYEEVSGMITKRNYIPQPTVATVQT